MIKPCSENKVVSGDKKTDDINYNCYSEEISHLTIK